MREDVSALQDPPHDDSSTTLRLQPLFPAMGPDSLRLFGPWEIITNVGTVEHSRPATASTQASLTIGQGACDRSGCAQRGTGSTIS